MSAYANSRHPASTVKRSSLEFGADAGGRREAQVTARDDRFSATKPLQLFSLPFFSTSIDCFRRQQLPQRCVANSPNVLVSRVGDQIFCLFGIGLKVEQLRSILDVVDVLVTPEANGERSGG